MDTGIIIKYIKGEATSKEKDELVSWVREDEAHKRQFVKLKNAWSLAAIQQGLPEQETERRWEVFRRKVFPRYGLKRKILPVLKYAAILIIAFGAGLVGEKFLFQQVEQGTSLTAMTVLDVPAGQSAQITLPDGTDVYLNSGSKITYGDRFVGEKRVVQIEGEAFFDVKTDLAHPFIVETEKLDLQVYGTSFNVETYKGIDLNVTLVEGSLGLQSKTGEELVRMKPGQNAVYNEVEKRIALRDVDTEMYTSWRNGIVTFRNADLSEIAGKIERWYNVEIEILTEDLSNQKYSGTLLKSKPVDQILEALSLTASFTYEIEYRDNEPSLIKLKKVSN